MLILNGFVKVCFKSCVSVANVMGCSTFIVLVGGDGVLGVEPYILQQCRLKSCMLNFASNICGHAGAFCAAALSHMA